MRKNRAPTIPAIQIADIAGGGQQAVTGILLALHERHHSGRGQYIDISMTDGVLPLLSLSYILEKKTHERQGRSTSMLSHRYGCYNSYETKEGRFLAIGAVENRFWVNLCRVLDIPEYETLQYSEEKREEIIVRLRDIFRQKPIGHWDEILAGADVCYSRIQPLEEVFTDPLFLEREMVVDVPGIKGSEKCFGIPVKLSRTAGTIRTPPQYFGQATTEVLAELGYGHEEIERLQEKGVV